MIIRLATGLGKRLEIGLKKARKMSAKQNEEKKGRKNVCKNILEKCLEKCRKIQGHCVRVRQEYNTQHSDTK